MSSPLSFFRRNQKVLLAVFGVLIMLTFVVGDYISRYQTGRSGPAVDETVVTWKQGKLDEQELAAIRNARILTVRFLDLLAQKTIDAKGQPRGMGISRSYAEEDLVQTMILARKAQDLGVRVSDGALDEFLDTLTDGVVPRSQFGPLLREATQGRFDRAQLFDQLRLELAAQQMRMMAGSGLFAMSPSLTWDAFNRLNRRVKAELLPLPVADFESQVAAQPTEAQIAALYEDGKQRYPEPSSSEAGFKRRRKIAFQYLKADFEKFLQEQMAALTKEQVAEYYEKNKNDFKVTEPPPAAEPKPAEGAKPAEEAKPAEQAQPAEGAKPADSPRPTPEEPKKPESEPTAKQPPADAPAAGAKDEVELKLDAPASEAAPEEKAKQSSNEFPRPSRGAVFVSYNGDDAAPAASAPAPAQPTEPAAVAAPAEKEPAAPKEPAAEPAAEAKPEAKPAETPAKIKPLSEVETEIRRNLARAPAQDKVNAALKAAKAELDAYFKTHASWKANSKQKVQEPEPTPPALKELADKNGLIADEIPLVDELQVGGYELGKAFRFSFAGNQFRRESFAEIAYTDRQPLYKADQIRSFEVDVEFLYWKVKEEEAFVPKLEDIRAEVVTAWKLGEAYQIAKAEAEKIAKSLPVDKPLKAAVDKAQATKILEPAEFSWLTRGSLPTGARTPMLSSVEGVEFPSMEFMRAIFALRPGEVGVAANGPQTIVYVVRVAAESPSEEARRKQFVEGGMTEDMTFVARVELETFLSQWYRDLEKEVDLHWNRPPLTMQMVE